MKWAKVTSEPFGSILIDTCNIKMTLFSNKISLQAPDFADYSRSIQSKLYRKRQASRNYNSLLCYRKTMTTVPKSMDDEKIEEEDPFARFEDFWWISNFCLSLATFKLGIWNVRENVILDFYYSICQHRHFRDYGQHKKRLEIINVVLWCVRVSVWIRLKELMRNECNRRGVIYCP